MRAIFCSLLAGCFVIAAAVPASASLGEDVQRFFGFGRGHHGATTTRSSENVSASDDASAADDAPGSDVSERDDGSDGAALGLARGGAQRGAAADVAPSDGSPSMPGSPGAPEIDAGTAVSALALAAGVLVMMRERRRRV